MKVNTKVKAGEGSSTDRVTANHNEKQTKSVIVKTGIKAGQDKPPIIRGR